MYSAEAPEARPGDSSSGKGESKGGGGDKLWEAQRGKLAHSRDVDGGGGMRREARVWAEEKGTAA